MELPRVNPIGLLDSGGSGRDAPAVFPPLCLLAGLLLVLFLLGTMVTTVVSLGRYCLTTYSTDTHALPVQKETR